MTESEMCVPMPNSYMTNSAAVGRAYIIMNLREDDVFSAHSHWYPDS